jgi:hypothetical protein
MTIKALYPNVRPSLDLNFARTRALDPRITFTRASTGTFVGSDGLIKTAAINAPRFDHNPTTGESLGLLVEEARTNRVAWSFGRTLFTRGFCPVNTFTGSLVVGEVFTSSNGGTFRLIRYSGGIAHFLAVAGDQNLGNVPLTATSGTITNIGTSNSQYNAAVGDGAWINYSPATVTSVLGNTIDIASGRWGFSVSGKTAGAGCICSIFVKVLDPSVDRIYLTQNNGGDGDTQRLYTLSTDTFSGIAGTGTVQGVQKFSNGWYRFHWGRTSMTSTNPGFNLTAQDSSGTEVNGGVYLDGGQIDDGAFMTSYIPTSGTAATRAADVASVPTTGWIDTTGGTILAEYYKRIAIQGSGNYIWSLGDGNPMIMDGWKAELDFAAGIMNTTGPVVAGKNKIIFKFEQGNYAISANGSAVSTSTLGNAWSSAPSSLRIATGSAVPFGAKGLHAPIARLTYWPTRLPDAQLQALTQ